MSFRQIYNVSKFLYCIAFPVTSIPPIYVLIYFFFLWRIEKQINDDEFNLVLVLNSTFCSAEVKEPLTASRRRCCPTLPHSQQLLSGSVLQRLPALLLSTAIGWQTWSRDHVQFEMYSRAFLRRLSACFLNRWDNLLFVVFAVVTEWDLRQKYKLGDVW